MKYYVVFKIFKDDKSPMDLTPRKKTVKVITAEEAEKLGYYNGMARHMGEYMLYVDGFMDLKEAQEWAQDARDS